MHIREFGALGDGPAVPRSEAQMDYHRVRRRGERLLPRALFLGRAMGMVCARRLCGFKGKVYLPIGRTFMTVEMCQKDGTFRQSRLCSVSL